MFIQISASSLRHTDAHKYASMKTFERIVSASICHGASSRTPGKHAVLVASCPLCDSVMRIKLCDRVQTGPSHPPFSERHSATLLLNRSALLDSPPPPHLPPDTHFQMSYLTSNLPCSFLQEFSIKMNAISSQIIGEFMRLHLAS